MPVNIASFDEIATYDFPSGTYERLYEAINEVNKNATAVAEPSFAGYYNKIYALYDALREQQKLLPARYQSGESEEALASELWELFRSIK